MSGPRGWQQQENGSGNPPPMIPRSSSWWTNGPNCPTEAREYADSIARRGRAVAENLIAATQRPTQDAMGKGTAVRSQMDIRICLRVREPRDADLILGQGMVNSGWHAHKLTKPGEFLISDPEHTMPEREPRLPAHRRPAGPPRVRMRADAAPASPRRAGRARPGCAPTAPEPPQAAPDGPPDGDGRSPARDGAVGRPGRRRPGGDLGRGAGSRMRHGPQLGLLPAPGARQGRPGRAGPARLLARCPAVRQPGGDGQ